MDNKILSDDISVYEKSCARFIHDLFIYRYKKD